ncbi:MAG TPA: hypothetical protein DCS43_16455 [Verrucomicrobia bacterium]|nr:hypothetical protein [Verrucomicrobiota bacterium]
MRNWFSIRNGIAVLVALLGSVIIWGVVPYNNFSLNNTYISDSFIPEIVIALMLLLVLLINPLLRLVGPRWVLSRSQVALISGLMLFSAILPGNGLMRMFPRFVAQINQEMNAGGVTSKIAAEVGFRSSLFPDPLPELTADGQVRTYETPISDQFLDELYEGQSVPWSAWVVPMAAWGMLIFALWMMMTGLGGIVYPQWREQERLPFPLLNVYHALIGDPEDDVSARVLPACFYNKVFWIGCISVMIIHAFRGLSIFTHGAFPDFPLSWDLSPYFTDGLMRSASGTLKNQMIFFSIVGVAFFIPSRYSISIWGWVYGYAWYITLGNAYIPAFREGQVDNQAFGALLAIAVWVLWLGRSHWATVGRAMLGRARGSDENFRDAVAGWMFALGGAGIVLWLYWAGCSLWWSVLAMVGCALVALLMARIIAETGIPVLWMGRMSVAGLTALLPASWLSPVILLFSSVLGVLVGRMSAMSAAVITTLALGMDRTANPKTQARLLLGGLAVLLLGFVICGAVHLNMGYHSSQITTQAKVGAAAINDWSRMEREPYHFFTPERTDQAVGMGGGLGLLWACSRFPSWPIHPVGIIFCRISIGNLMWFSVFLGWLFKTAITRLFGGGAYRKSRPFFLGLIIGELLSIIIWTLVPVIIIWLTGANPADVPRYMLMRYP